MCGIVALYKAGGEGIVRPMLDSIRHRGPDDHGVHENGDVCLGVRRLSVIDVEGGHQPVFNENGTVGAVLNGEIYNYADLRTELLELRHHFKSKGDTEVIVHGFEEWGLRGVVERLRGMFTLAISATDTHRLLIARDRLGIKPLYIARASQGWAFASEIKALLVHPDISARINEQKIPEQLANRFVSGDQTMFAGINRVEPGTFAEIANGEIKWYRYWEAPEADPEFRPSFEEAADRVRDLVRESVRYRLVSDVAVGALLSGGLDSTVIVSQMAAASATRPKTFTVGFSPTTGDERPYAKAVSKEIGTDHTEHLVALRTADELERVVWHMDEPLGDAAALPTLLISEVARQQVTVALTGEGGDELFGGYPRYRLSVLADRLHRLPRAMWRPFLKLATRLPGLGGHVARRLADADPDRLLRNALWMSDLEPNELLEIHPAITSWKDAYGCDSDLAPWRQDLNRWLLNDVLLKVDKMSMAASLEARVPLLDHKLVEYVSRIPDDLRTAWLGKKLLRHAFAAEIPEISVQRPKAPFKPPLDEWFKGALGTRLDDLAKERGSFTNEYLSPAGVKALLDKHRSGRSRGLSLWNLLVIEVWWRKFFSPS